MSIPEKKQYDLTHFTRRRVGPFWQVWCHECHGGLHDALDTRKGNSFLVCPRCNIILAVVVLDGIPLAVSGDRMNELLPEAYIEKLMADIALQDNG